MLRLLLLTAWASASGATSTATTTPPPATTCRPSPRLSYPVQRITTGADGALTLPFSVAATMPTWTNDNPEITSVTPQAGTAGVGDYAPKPRDYYFFTLAGPGIPSS
ncbi:MAG: hypothetical protein ABI068_00640 [Ktedonobacterales bacterium]